MIDTSTYTHHPAITEIVSVLCNRTQNTDTGFFKTEVAYFLCEMASCMRATILTKDRGEIPVNCYAINTATSGAGKGFSLNIMEEEFLRKFKDNFLVNVMPPIAERTLAEVAGTRAIRNNTTQEEELSKAEREYNALGPYPFTFDSGTSPAVKQLRQKLLMAGSGSINLIIDEIGSNLLNNIEILNTYLELYDKGLVKTKLTKHTNESKRYEDIAGSTPANMMLFGTPVKIFDGGMTEDAFYSFLEIGYARRCIFGIGKKENKALYTQTASEIFHNLISPSNQAIIDKWSAHFANLAQEANFKRQLFVEDDVSIFLIDYKIKCEAYADTLPDHQEIQKAELSHRYFKALKLAGAYAFIDNSPEVTLDHVKQAILLVEESGKAFLTILDREKPYMKLANYLSKIDKEVNHADLDELPYYPSSMQKREELIAMATAWGYSKNIMIRRTKLDSIDFFSGESLEETDINKIKFSLSNDIALGYTASEEKFTNLPKMLAYPGGVIHWANHSFTDGHRAGSNVIPGFNLVVIDVDTGFKLDSALDLLKSYTYLIHTTKRHTEECNRYRILLPIKYVLKLNREDYKNFMNNILNWLPFQSDEGANQPERKWETNPNCKYWLNEGELLDPLKFIPKTSKNEAYKKEQREAKNLPALEKWLLQDAETAGRNNTLIKYAFVLLDQGKDQAEIERAVKSFNSKLPDPLPEEEIRSTIFVSIARKIAEQF